MTGSKTHEQRETRCLGMVEQEDVDRLVLDGGSRDTNRA